MSFLDKLIKYNILNLNPEGISNVNFKIEDNNLKIQGFLIAKKTENYNFTYSKNVTFSSNKHFAELNLIKFDTIHFEATQKISDISNSFDLVAKEKNTKIPNHFFSIPNYVLNKSHKTPNLELRKKIGCDDKTWYICGGYTQAKKYLNLANTLIGKDRKFKILDIGGGTGRISHHLHKMGHDICIFDNDIELTNYSKSLGLRTVNDLKSLKSEKFDLIFSHSLFPHLQIDEIKKVLKKSSMILKQNGIICMSYLSHAALLFEAVNKYQIILFLLNKNIKVNNTKYKFHPALLKTKGKFPDYYCGNFFLLKDLIKQIPKNLIFEKNVKAYSNHQDVFILKKLN